MLENNLGKYIGVMAVVVFAVAGLLSVNHFLGLVITPSSAIYYYLPLIYDFTNITIGIIASYIIYKILLSIFVPYAAQGTAGETGELAKLLLRMLLFAAIIVIALTSLGISLSGALAGGAVGGIVLGLAVQSVATSLLSGFFLSSSRVILPGKVVVLYSWMFGGNVLCRVQKVNPLFTEVKTQNGYLMHIPNNILFNSTVFTHAEAGPKGRYSYSFNVTMNADVPTKKLLSRANAVLKKELQNLNAKDPEIYLSTKSAGNTNVLNVIVYFETIEQANQIINLVNLSLDNAYHQLKDMKT